jgi:hypothetical protein
MSSQETEPNACTYQNKQAKEKKSTRNESKEKDEQAIQIVKQKMQIRTSNRAAYSTFIEKSMRRRRQLSLLNC